MSLRIKILLAIVLVLMSSIALDYAILHLGILNSFAGLERAAAQRDLIRCVYAIQNEIGHLDQLAHDWAAWDDTYAYVADRNEAYAAANLLPETFTAAQINLLYIVDPTGRVVWGRVYDLRTGQELHLRDFPADVLPPDHPLLTPSAPYRPVSGVLLTGHAPMLVASRPILTSAEEGPSRGMLIMGRFLDEAAVAALRQQVDVDLSVWPLPESLPGAPAADIPLTPEELARLATGGQFLFRDQAGGQSEAYTTLAGLQGRPALLLRVATPREFIQIGNAVMHFTVTSILAVGMMVLLVMWIFLRRVVTDPVAMLTQHVLAAKTAGDLAADLSLHKEDEIGILAREFDGLVTQMKGRAAELARINEALRREIAERERAEGELRRQNLYLEALHETALALMNRLELADVLTAIVTRAAQLLDTPHGYLYLGEPGATEIELKVGTGLYTGHMGCRLKSGEGLAGKVWQSGRPLLVRDYTTWPEHSPQFSQDMIHAAVGVPLKSGPQVVGVIGLAHVEAGRTFDEPEVELLSRFAGLASIALDNVRLFQEERRHVERLGLLNRIARTLGATLDLDELLEVIYREITAAVQADAFFIALYDRETDELDFRVRVDQGVREPPDRRPLSPGLTATVVASKRPLLIRDLEREKEHLPPVSLWGTMQMPSSWLGVPVLLGEQVVGVISVQAYRSNAYGEAEQELLCTIADQIAVAVENARLFEQTRRSAEELRTFGEILRTLNATPDAAQNFTTVATALQTLTGCQRVSVVLLDERYERYTIAALDRPRPELPTGATLPVSTTAAAADVLAGRLHLTPDLAAEAHFPAEQALYRAGHRSRVNLPLRVGARIIGALNMVWAQPAGYVQANLALLGQVADAVALALERGRLFAETSRHVAILEALADAGEKLLAPGDPGRVLPEVLARLGQAVGVSRVYIFENHTASDGTLLTSQRYEWVAAGQTPQIDNPDLQNFPYEAAGFERWVAVLGAGNPLYGLVRDFPAAERAVLEAQQIISIAVVPIFCESAWWGFVGFDDCVQGRVWSSAEIEALRSAAGALGAAFARQRSEAAERAQRTLAEALRDTAAVLTGTLSFDEVLDRILVEAGRVVPHDAANFMLIESGVARIVRCRGYAERGTEEVVLSLRFPVAEVANLRQMLETGQPSVIPDTHSYPGWIDIPESRWVRSYLSAPIRSKGQVVGFLNLDSASPGFFTAAHAERLQAFADQAGIAVENARLYEELRRHAGELERRVAERTAELSQREAALRAANEKLKELDQLKSRFVSNVSHELRTPLANIKVLLYLLEKGRPDKRDYYMATLNRETDLLTYLIEDLLQLSRFDLGATQPVLAPLDLNHLVGTLAADRAMLIAERKLTLETRLTSDLPTVLADGKMLMQVITNLMTNAMNYTPPGGTITLGTGVKQEGAEGETETWVTFYVSDTGPGIAPEERAHLFERFYRGEAGRRSKAPGTGLGLAICREIVERHGGKITLDTEVGRGSTFTVWLPVVKREADHGEG